jgi:hypothetical protein
MDEVGEFYNKLTVMLDELLELPKTLLGNVGQLETVLGSYRSSADCPFHYA